LFREAFREIILMVHGAGRLWDQEHLPAQGLTEKTPVYYSAIKKISIIKLISFTI
jgi:hypothetical protein